MLGVLLIWFLRLLRLPLAPLRWILRAFGKGDYEPYTPSGHWQNCIKNQFTRPDTLVTPASAAEIEKLLRQAQQSSRKVRAVGAGHSFTEVAVCDDLVINPIALKHFEVLDGSTLHANTVGSLVRVGAGLRIRELNSALLEAELALENMGAYDIQTISGAISTATHGSGVSLGPLCDAVRSLELLTSREHILLEPTNGISDPEKYALKFPVGPRLVQDDRLFHAAVVSMGSMGIVCGYTLAVRQAYLLRETRTCVEWNALRERLIAGEFRRTRHYEVFINPYVAKHQKRWCLVTVREEAPAGKPRTVGAKTRNPIATFVTSVRLFDRIIVYLFRRVPELAPWLIQASLDGLADREYIDQSSKVLNLGDANLVPAYASEFAFDASEASGVPAFIQAVDHFLVLAEEQRRAGRWHSSPISLRFVAASPHYLAPQHKRVTCMMEIPFVDGTPFGWELLSYYERRLAVHGMRPHWGQVHSHVSAESVRRLYSEFPSFVRAFVTLNHDATFDNTFTERLSLRLHEELVKLREGSV